MSEARDAFEVMVRNELGPLLRAGGLTGTYREFRLREGDQEGVVAFTGWAKANRGRTYSFNFDVKIRDRLTGTERPLPRLDNLAVADPGSWKVVPGQPTLALAEELAQLILKYALTAIRMDLVFPDMRDRAPRVKEKVSPEERSARVDAAAAARNDIHDATSRLELLEFLDSGDEEHQKQALIRLVREFKDDPSTVQGVKDSLKKSPSMQYYACFWVRRLGLSSPDVVEALRKLLHAEHAFRRWEARFDLMLLGEDHLVAIEEAKRRPFPEVPEAPVPKPMTIEKLLTPAGDEADPRITPFTAAVLRPEATAPIRHALPDGANQTLCGLGKSDVRRLSACFLLDDLRSCDACQRASTAI